jgi:hypothetical protein
MQSVPITTDVVSSVMIAIIDTTQYQLKHFLYLVTIAIMDTT